VAETVGDAGVLARTAAALRAYRLVAGMWLRAALAYRASFWVTTFGNALTSVFDFVVIAIMFLHTDALGGWTLPQVGFLYGTSGLTLGLADLTVGSLDQLGTCWCAPPPRWRS
jgi:ABC-2 type transport system permease protein